MAVLHKLCHSYCQVQDYEQVAKGQDERVLLLLRAHPITNIGWLMMGTILALIPLFFANYLSSLSLNSNQEFCLIVFWYGFVFSYLLNKFYFWYFNIGVVTNQKIVDVDANNLLNTVTTATTIAKVEEVEKRSLGIVSSFFNYGDVHVETAGEFPNIEFLRVPNPAEIVKVINSNMRAHGHYRPSTKP